MDVLKKFINIYTNDNKEKITGVDQGVKFALKQQYKRWDSLGITFKEEIEPSGALKSGYSVSRKDGNLISKLYYQTCLRKIKIIKNKKELYDSEEKQILYINESDCIDKNKEENDIYICPGCGATSTVKELLNGCPYCGSHFVIEDLYPIITNYYFLSDFSLSEKESKKMILKWCLSFATIFSLFFTITYIIERKSIFEIVLSLIMSILLGSFIGYMTMSLKLLVKLIIEAVRSIETLNKIGFGFRKNKRIKEQINGFSQAEFEGKIMADLKMIIFSDDIEDLAIYEGNPLKDTKNIIDVTYGGGVGLKKHYVEDGMDYLVARIPLDNLYYLNDKIKKKREYFELVAYKDIKANANNDFSIFRIKCHNCSQSFDGRYQMKCPYCGSEYRLSQDDWVISKLERV